MYNAGKVEALANSKTETNAFSREPQQTKSRVIFFSPLFFFYFVTFFFAGQVATQVVVRCSFPSRPRASFFFFLYPRESDARRDTDTRADTLEKPLTRLAAVLRGDPRTCGETQRSRLN